MPSVSGSGGTGKQSRGRRRSGWQYQGGWSPPGCSPSPGVLRLGLLGVDRIPRGESRLRRSSCRMAAMRCSLASAATGDDWQLRQKAAC
ncbi:unnamed protein product [Spirodela intermedia]|uniref:Uncharacterized protein n=1 Tax=Spirodela intermedia TaxID=51605 RepID=A0A7I8J2D0_SPIIN|nr:unnamed protein product [Spirodela intermedia]CAA6664219.1 unnamed protein product [Spirodela intermedia]